MVWHWVVDIKAEEDTVPETTEISIWKSIKTTQILKCKADVSENVGQRERRSFQEKTTLEKCKAFGKNNEKVSLAGAYAVTVMRPRNEKSCRALGIQHDHSHASTTLLRPKPEPTDRTAERTAGKRRGGHNNSLAGERGQNHSFLVRLGKRGHKT